ncbi:unnamed protein product [Acanthoscelides obtectus]|nr:unnamed protein product [Acanthoscelides obtectus]CAK1629532.1 Laccase-11 [Acanthoscelides obtectus]
MINALASPCGVVMSTQGHTMTVIATDGENVNPRTVEAITSYSGERYDFILVANQAPGRYWMQFYATDNCEEYKITQFAILQYNARPSRLLGSPSSYDQLKNEKKLTLNPPLKTCADDLPDGVCVSSLRSSKSVQTDVLKQIPDIKMYMAYNFSLFEPGELFVPNTYTKYAVFLPGPYIVSSFMNHLSFSFPPAPLLTQYQDVADKTCNMDNIPRGCSSNSIRNCSCTHVVYIPLGAVVEIVFIDEVAFDDAHAFHLHGYAYHVLGMGSPGDFGLQKLDRDLVIRLDQQGRLKRNFVRPPSKDTLVVPNQGYSVIRFKADNPGSWLFHCHYEVHTLVGMAFVVQVGDPSDLPPVPDGFPRCGNFLPNRLDETLRTKEW